MDLDLLAKYFRKVADDLDDLYKLLDNSSAMLEEQIAIEKGIIRLVKHCVDEVINSGS